MSSSPAFPEPPIARLPLTYSSSSPLSYATTLTPRQPPIYTSSTIAAPPPPIMYEPFLPAPVPMYYDVAPPAVMYEPIITKPDIGPRSCCTKALLIAVNYRNGACGQQLFGSINDMRSLALFLEDQGWARHNIVIMDEDKASHLQPTYDNILRMMQWLVAGAKSGDALFLGYSGHCGSAKASSGEVIIPDSFVSSDSLLVTPDVYQPLLRNLPEGSVLTALTDSPYGGCPIDLSFKVRSGARTVVPKYLPGPSGRVVCFSGKPDDSTSIGDCDITAGYVGGAVINAFLAALSYMGTPVGYGALLREMTRLVRDRRMTQVPVLTSSHQILQKDPVILTPPQLAAPLRPIVYARSLSLNPYLDIVDLDKTAAANRKKQGAFSPAWMNNFMGGGWSNLMDARLPTPMGAPEVPEFATPPPPERPLAYVEPAYVAPPPPPPPVQSVPTGLYLTVDSGSNIKAKDFLGLKNPDPYVVIGLDGQPTTARTKYCNSTINPKWGETFVLDVPSNTSSITFGLWDYDMLSKDDQIGSATLNITQRASGVQTIPVQMNKPVPDSSLTVKLDWIPNTFNVTGQTIHRVAGAGSEPTKPANAQPVNPAVTSALNTGAGKLQENAPQTGNAAVDNAMASGLGKLKFGN